MAGALTDKVGGGRLMALGLLLQGIGLAWTDLVATSDTPYSRMVGAMVVAGIGMGLVFAPTAAVVLGSVGPQYRGKASGANNTVREIGGALGTAVLSSVFVHCGNDRTAQGFVDGMRPAIWIGVAVVLVGALCALAIPRPRPEEAVPAPAAGDRRAERTPSSATSLTRPSLPRGRRPSPAVTCNC
ncbi:MFS transporter [Streptomyces poonensis]|uniref:Major facilitator superfamily (MFS) profile domain-containing protein n=1 Tax=Streptomyces poonensis TaxID=68255 RepID=A0A918PEU7_9ACTN|nr:MFS transporter [Streptomyces poonensis]GGZ03549.1 hypothetical protein GCM10010365_23000 [Streptomyces poonensis]GLJ90739.1 hypothetical protein GCM10017589_33440 [Streptomyces poonensis]